MFRELKSRLTWLSAAVLVCTVGVNSAHAGWNWRMDAKRYQTLDVFERAQYNKALSLFVARNYKAAASEFEKFKVQFSDSQQLSNILFMRGYSLHHAKNRITAIKAYSEVLDFFPDEVDDASAALYHTAVAYCENGDIRKGLQCFKQMVTHEKYSRHSLAAGALTRLASNHWQNKEYGKALTYWKQCYKDFITENPGEAWKARDQVFAYYIKSQDYKALERWLLDDKTRNDAQTRTWIATHAMGMGHGNFGHAWGKYLGPAAKEKKADMKALYLWYKSCKPWFDKANRTWTHYDQSLNFLIHRWNDPDEKKSLMEQMMVYLKKAKDAAKDAKAKAKIDPLYCRMCDLTKDGRLYDQARFCVAQISDPFLAAWKEYEIRSHQGKWESAVVQLIEIENRNDAKWKAQALESRAFIYKERLGQFDKAIAVYRAISAPPRTLWAIQDCQKRAGKLKAALVTLSEIESMFPNERPRVLWTKAVYYDQAGNAKMAIAHARRLLKAYPKSPESSGAHQLLERHNIETGGGVSDEE